MSSAASNAVSSLTVSSPAPDGAGQPSQGIIFKDTLAGPGYAWTHAAIYSVGSAGFNGNLVFATDGDNLPNNNPVERMRLDYRGFLGIGTTTPGATLEVNGSGIMLTHLSGGAITFSDATVQSTARTGTLAYSRLVGGVFATKLGVTGRHQPKSKPADDEVPMTMVGIVPTKVSAENGSIQVGDLLVSSSSAGYAMKASDEKRSVGTVVGKALGSLDSGKGMIEVLISLQ